MQNLWAYSYQIAPPLAADLLGTIRSLLRDEAAAARDAERAWSARLVLEHGVTQILIVSDDPAQDREINRRLEAELARFDAAFSVTQPMAAQDPPSSKKKPAIYHGNGR